MKLTSNTRRFGVHSARLLALCAFALLCLTGLVTSTFSFDLRMDGALERASVVAVNESGDRSQSETAGTQDTARTERARAQLVEKLYMALDAQGRAETACSIGKAHAVEAIPQLIAMLGDDTPIKLIKCWENGRWSPAIETLKQPSPGEQAAIALASMGIMSLKPLITALNDSNSSVRRNAAWAIGELTNMREGDRDDAVAPLVLLLRDSSDWVRVAAARALGEIRDERAADGLIELLSDSQSRVRETAAWALGEMKERRGVESLCNLVASDAEPEVRSTAAWALGEMQDRRAVETLCHALISDPQSQVRSTAAWALGEIQSQKAVSFLNQALSDGDKAVRAKALRALAEIEGTNQ